jgi:hypothetical protein
VANSTLIKPPEKRISTISFAIGKRSPWCIPIPLGRIVLRFCSYLRLLSFGFSFFKDLWKNLFTYSCSFFVLRLI